jgi:hypothetical protein
MKILIAVPTFENIYPDVFKAIYDLKKPEGTEFIFEFVRGYDCATARNAIVTKGQLHKADYILMIDNDVIVPEDTVVNFLDDPVDVCLGSYPHRDTDNIYRGRTCICKLIDYEGNKYYNYPLESEYTAKELIILEESGEKKIQIHGGGMGCAFIKTSVFEQIDYPWYDWVNYGDNNRGMLSEDLYFCEQCKRIGTPIYTDTRVRCKHILRHAQECV